MFRIKIKNVQSYCQSYIDKKIDAFIKNEQLHRQRTDELVHRISSLEGMIVSLQNKHKKLVSHLGLEYKEETTKGYVKAKKLKK